MFINYRVHLQNTIYNNFTIKKPTKPSVNNIRQLNKCRFVIFYILVYTYIIILLLHIIQI